MNTMLASDQNRYNHAYVCVPSYMSTEVGVAGCVCVYSTRPVLRLLL